jgi:hypothetical protein
MSQLVENVSVVVVQREIDFDLSARKFRELLRGHEWDDALFLPLVDRRNGSIGSKGSRDSGAPTKKRLGRLDKHVPEHTVCWN